MATIRLLYRIRKLMGFTQWQTLLPDHHEDPLKMTPTEKLYMGYKYYYKAMVLPQQGCHTDTYLQNQDMEIKTPAGFVATETITLSAGGDLIPYTCIQPQNCQHLWDEAGDYFFNNDIVFANLETVADPARPYSAAPEVMLNDMYFNIHQESFGIFSGNGKYRGYDVLSTANNHSMDMGETGILATQAFLERQNIAWCGTATSAQTVDEFPIIEKKGIRIAFLAYTFSLNKESLPAGKEWLCNHILLNEAAPDLEPILRQAAVARSRGADLIVASLHMGCAYQAYPGMHIINNIHQICRETGIDIILAGHPHNPQPMEIFETQDKISGQTKQHFIAYSLGDFIAFDIYKWCHLPLILKLQVSKGSIDGQPHTQLTGIEVRPFYMYQNKNKELRLVGFERVADHPEKHFPEKEVVEEVRELKDFFDRFVVTERQRHLLFDANL